MTFNLRFKVRKKLISIFTELFNGPNVTVDYEFGVWWSCFSHPCVSNYSVHEGVCC